MLWLWSMSEISGSAEWMVSSAPLKAAGGLVRGLSADQRSTGISVGHSIDINTYKYINIKHI